MPYVDYEKVDLKTKKKLDEFYSQSYKGYWAKKRIFVKRCFSFCIKKQAAQGVLSRLKILTIIYIKKDRLSDMYPLYWTNH